MTQAMLLFSLGPVQSFIAQARKTRDLWLGSYLLSLLMEASMEGIAASALIFPAAPHVQGTIADLPNKYIALFPDVTSAQTAAELSERQLKRRWLHICRDVWNRVLTQQSTAETRQIWERQTNPEHVFEIFWVIVEGDEQHYPEWLRRTQEALAARKRLRTVRWREAATSEQWNEPGEKSTISGEREALRNQDDTHEGVHAFWQKIASHFARDLNQNGEERLDAIDTVKRFAFLSDVLTDRNTLNASFPSTSSIAAAPFVHGLLTTPLDATTIKEWLDSTQSPLDRMEQNTIPYLERVAGTDPYKRVTLQRDGDCYFLETFTPHRLKKDYGLGPLPEASRRADRGKDALGRLLHETDAHLIQRPTPYYALFQMDGDRIGRLLGGVENRQEHSAISTALSIFSRQRAAEIVQESYPGRLIYAGGDDALALAPLYHDDTTDGSAKQACPTIFALVERLQAEYCATIKKVIGSEERQRAVSTSVGIVIAHHYASLSYVRRMTRAAEEAAKKEYGRDALVVIVLRRSGEQTKVGCHWEYSVRRQGETLTIRPLALFNEFYALFKHGALSPHSIYTLLEEAPTLVALEQAIQRSEIARILQRHRTRELPQPEIDTLARRLVELATAMDERQPEKSMRRASELHAPGPRHGLVEASGWLLVMNFIARKEQS